MKERLTQDLAREYFDYDADTGILRWRKKSCKRVMVGEIAGDVNKNGYRYISVRYSRHTAQRIIWLYMTGEWPECVDHINGVKDDNRFCNLRASTRRLNAQNMRHSLSRSKTGLLGVQVSKNGFSARIHTNGKSTYLGRFKTAQEAHECYLMHKRQLHESCTI